MYSYSTQCWAKIRKEGLILACSFRGCSQPWQGRDGGRNKRWQGTLQLQLGVGADLDSACTQLRPQNGASHIKAEPFHFKEHNLENSSQTRPETCFRGESKSHEVDTINITQRYLHYSFTTGTTLGIGYDNGKPAYSLLLPGKILSSRTLTAAAQAET